MTNEKKYKTVGIISETENDAIRREMTIEEICSLPNILGKLAATMCREFGEYKCVIGNQKTHIVLVAK